MKKPLLLILFLTLIIALSVWRSHRPPRPAQAGTPQLAPVPYVQQTPDGKTVLTVPIDQKTGKAGLAAVPKELLPQLSTLERIELRRVNPDGTQTVVGTVNTSELKRGDK